jgi:hypothetical protein
MKNLLIDMIFVTKKFSDDLFRAAPYTLMLVLHKDALFHLTIFCNTLYATYPYAGGCYTEYLMLRTFILSVAMLAIFILSVIMLNVFMLDVAMSLYCVSLCGMPWYRFTIC